MLRFSLIDYTTNQLGTTTIIEEVVGWDAITMRLKRDKTWHGFFDFFDDAMSGLQFDSESGYQILKNAYETNGAEAKVDLLIEFQCDDNDAYEDLYTGKFAFTRYKDFCTERCYLEVGVETTSCLMTFKNRYDQKVDLDSDQSFDFVCEEDTITVSAGNFNAAGKTITLNDTGIVRRMKSGMSYVISGTANNDGTYTVDDILSDVLFTVVESLVNEVGVGFDITGCFQILLTAYDGLNKQIQLPGKIIEFKNDWGIKPSVYAYEDEFGTGTAIAIPKHYIFPFDWDIDRVTEIRNSNPTRVVHATINPAIAPVVEFMTLNDGIIDLQISDDIKCIGETDIHIDMEGVIDIDSSDTMQFNGTINLVYGNDIDGYTTENLQTGFGCAGCNNSNNAISINFDDTITLKDGDRVYIYFIITNFQYTTGGGGGGPTDPFTLTMTIDSANVRVTTATECESTPVNVYMINEAMSRITEAYTNDCLRVYSDYFGRTDAQPYTSDEDGCGGLEAITSGLKIRAKDGTVQIGDTGVTPKVTVSMKEVFDAMNAVHNIGMGIEDDPNRPGEEMIRVEPVNHFYNNSVLMTCTNITKVTREVNAAELFSIVKAGYAKWETENVNGLNDPFGQREYRTMLTSVRNTYDRICKFIASDYAIEVTRRKYGSTTKDWKYDNDMFIICLKACWSGEVGWNTLTDYIQIHAGADLIYNQIQTGDVIEVSGSSQGNDGTYTVGTIDAATEDELVFELVEGLPGSAGVDNITICNITRPFKIVETDSVASSSGLLHPETSYNLRITPARNVMRHFKTILMSYRDYLQGELKFTNGDGNFLAQIELDVINSCLDENNDCDGAGDEGTAQQLPENADITLNKFSCPDGQAPLYRPERVKYEYPVTWSEYKVIAANPYGEVHFQCGDGPIEEGWIDDFQLKPTGPNGGLATFILKPKI